MIKIFLNWIKNFFYVEEKDPHLVLYEDVLEPDIPVVCEKHPEKFQKTCPTCRAAK